MTIQVLLAAVWSVSCLSQSNLPWCGSLVAWTDRLTANHRLGRRDLFSGTEVQLRALWDQWKTEKHAQTRLKEEEADWYDAPALLEDGSFRIRSFSPVPFEETNPLKKCCESQQRRWARMISYILNSIDSAGGLARQSPLKVLVFFINVAIAAEGLEAVRSGGMLPPRSIVALCVAVVIVCSMTGYVRSVANEIEYVDCLRWEAERRQANLERRSAEESL